jgi:NADPH-dependent 2,4-dienoyl-CoA reductase/sulfur reductase-like enzyme/rhodanese-related sulfurtransferase
MAEKHENLRILIIGGVATGPKTGAVLARRMPHAKITLFQKEDNISYGTCGLPYFASGDIASFEELIKTSYGIKRDAEFFRNTKGFNIITGAEVVSINRKNKQITVKFLDSGTVANYGYDKLVLAVGACPVQPSFPIEKSPLVRSFTRPEDALHFRQLAEQGQINKIMIVGGGFIGCEIAEAAASLWGIDVTLIEKERQILPYILDPEMSRLVELEFEKRGVTLFTGHLVERIELDLDKRPRVILNTGEALSADYIFPCLGVRPEIKLARDCGLDIGARGGIVVNDLMQTSDPDIFAGGDCVESTHQLTGEKIYMPMGSLANRHGRIIAENIAANHFSFPGVLGAFLIKAFDINVGAVGLSEDAAISAGFNVNTICGSFMDKPDYYPEAKSFTLKMIYDKNNGRLLGLQAVGAGDICRRTDAFSILLQNKATIENLLDFEHGYAPPYSEAIDSLHHLGSMAHAQQNGLHFIKPNSVEEEDIVWLDVREDDEVASVPWPYVQKVLNHRLVHVPLGNLRNRITELDSSSNIIIICRRGPRSYQAALILEQAGFKNVRIFGGGTQALLG